MPDPVRSVRDRQPIILFDGPRYDIHLRSVSGGRIASSLSAFVWTDSVESSVAQTIFHALLIAGSSGVPTELSEERLIVHGSVRSVCEANGSFLLSKNGCFFRMRSNSRIRLAICAAAKALGMRRFVDAASE
ncbi:hypothetical protein E2553_42300 [Paraburkholderia dipogonis]|uniref:Uncharacterized protein n=1 Tax=Paraburkholderia dipogonis TaxID=1211383 RepID=A0A4Y8MG17_9BURK|nr:hypothetical protein E2553_42300 [Paraburkholderia dipogonis]